MNPEELEFLAAQLRCPSGEHGLEVALKMNEGNRLINSVVLQALAPLSGTVLEIGMGNGYLVPEILNCGPDIRYIGCDISPDMVSASNSMNAQFVSTGRARFHLVEQGTTPPQTVADKVFTVNTIYFWDDDRQFLQNVKHVLAPAGTFVIGLRPS